MKIFRNIKNLALKMPATLIIKGKIASNIFVLFDKSLNKTNTNYQWLSLSRPPIISHRPSRIIPLVFDF